MFFRVILISALAMFSRLSKTPLPTGSGQVLIEKYWQRCVNETLISYFAKELPIVSGHLLVGIDRS
jgi:hypothetical protein